MPFATQETTPSAPPNSTSGSDGSRWRRINVRSGASCLPVSSRYFSVGEITAESSPNVQPSRRAYGEGRPTSLPSSNGLPCRHHMPAFSSETLVAPSTPRLCRTDHAVASLRCSIRARLKHSTCPASTVEAARGRSYPAQLLLPSRGAFALGGRDMWFMALNNTGDSPAPVVSIITPAYNAARYIE